MRRATIGYLVKKAQQRLAVSGIDSPFLEARLLLAHCLGCDHTHILAHPEDMVPQDVVETFWFLVARRQEGEPMAYILGYKEFWTHRFICSPATLIPRPETETVVEVATNRFNKVAPKRILDLGTGTGAIGISLAAQWTRTFVLLSDIDPKALEIARKNAIQILGGLDRVALVCSNWFEALREANKFDLITANPPYIAPRESDGLETSILKYEPHIALFSRGPDGMDQIREIFARAYRFLTPGGVVICEVGMGQAQAIKGYIEKELSGYREVVIHRDLLGVQRVVLAQVY